MSFLLIFLAVINTMGFLLMGYDKSQARINGQRVSEKSLFTCAAIGGALGSWIGMRMFRHKTKHLSFVIGMPLLIVVNALCVYYLMKMNGDL